MSSKAAWMPEETQSAIREGSGAPRELILAKKHSSENNGFILYLKPSIFALRGGLRQPRGGRMEGQDTKETEPIATEGIEETEVTQGAARDPADQIQVRP